MFPTMRVDPELQNVSFCLKFGTLALPVRPNKRMNDLRGRSY